MKFTTLFLLAATTVAVSARVPAVEPRGVDSIEAILASVSNLPKKSVSCGMGKGIITGRQTFKAKQIEKTAGATVQHIEDKSITPGNPQYPHNYRYRDQNVHLSSACTRDDGNSGKLFEFPIEANGIYKGPDVSHVPDRIIVKGKVKSNKAVYCGLITHRGAPGNNFNSCSG
ncbi:hypothetical protein FQN49_007103 [Arthroderma sp. PD_2]|nr:hypothetical protein FQN49_007103 [Arthroderma sp. PD_2]